MLPGPLDTETFLRIAIGITRALRDVHDAGILHADVKPRNVLVCVDDRRVKLADFGVASSMQHRSSSSDGGWVGTLPYLAPEQTGRTARRPDRRADLYSLGVTLFELLVGRLPFEASDPLEWIHAHLARTPPSPAELRPSIPPALSLLVLQLLHKAPEDRYPSATALLQDLEQCLDAWTATGAIPRSALTLGEGAEELRIPSTLFGRERELEAVTTCFDRAARAPRPTLLLASGQAGIGKTSVVAEIAPLAARANGIFARGKFDQLHHDVPYSAVGEALAEVVRAVAERDWYAVALALDAEWGSHCGE